MSSGIFNVPAATGVEEVKLQTTAGEAGATAPNSTVAREVEHNAEQTQQVAKDAANAAASLGSDYTGEKPSATSQLQDQVSETTNNAVNEGQRDVQAAKATGATYLDQAKAFAGSAFATAQEYLTSAQTAAQPHVDAAKGTIQPRIDAAMAAAQPHVDKAKDTIQPSIDEAVAAAQPHLEKAKQMAQGYIGAPTSTSTASNATPASSTGIPATTAPLESGAHTVNTPYPSPTTTRSTRIADNE